MQNHETHILSVCETRHITLRLRQHKFFAPTQRVTRPPTKGSELPSRGPDLPPSICQNTEAGGGGERKVTPRRRNKTANRISFSQLSQLCWRKMQVTGWDFLFCCCRICYKTAKEFRNGSIVCLSLKINVLLLYQCCVFSLSRKENTQEVGFAQVASDSAMNEIWENDL